ncbi:MAG: GerMN domain-containing protein [Coriobacteriia bacterium]|nr:GerMN domain-containing protein [Coriobacteriia bacterium]
MSNPRLHGTLALMLAFALAFAGLSLIPGCKRPAEETTDVETTTEPSQEPTVTLPADDGSSEPTAAPPVPQYVNVYFPRGDVLGVSRRQIPATKAVATAAMLELLLGPTGLEGDYGLHSEIPLGTDLNSVTIKNRVATVDLSDEVESGGGTLSMQMRLAQIVFTLTQFSTVDSVVFKIDGTQVDVFSGEGIMLDHPQTRGEYGNVLPAVLVEYPTPGESVPNPLRIKGMANVFEGTFLIEILDPNGHTIVDTFSSAGAMGEWKTFDIKVPFTTDHTGIGTLTISTESAMDGSHSVIVELPIKMTRE